MAIQFQPPPDWLMKEYFDRKSPVEQASQGLQGVLGSYITLQNQQKTQQNAGMKNLMDLINVDPTFINSPIGKRAMAEAGVNPSDFQTGGSPAAGPTSPAADPFSTPRAPSALGGVDNPDTVNPAGNDRRVIDHWNALNGGMSDQYPQVASMSPAPSINGYQPPVSSTGVAPSTPAPTPVPASAPSMFPDLTTLSDQEVSKHGDRGTKELTRRKLIQGLEKPDDKYYTTDQANKLVPDGSATFSSFPKDKVPRDAVHLMMSQGKTNEAGTNVTFAGVDPGGFPITMDKKGKMTLRGNPYDGPVYPKSSDIPTSASRTSSESAKNILNQINKIRPLIAEADKKGLIGPVAGRYFNQFEAGKIGTTGNSENDKLLGQIRSFDTFIKSGALKVHFGARGGQQMYDKFNTILNSGKQSSALYNGALDSIQSVLEGYAQEGTIGGGGINDGGVQHKVGEIVKGKSGNFKFKGGNWQDRNNWEPVP